MWKFLTVWACLLSQALGSVIFQSRAAMNLNLATDYRYTIASAFHAEEQISFYLRTIFNETDAERFTVLSVNAQVKDEGVISESRTSLETVVSMVYISDEPLMVATLLVERIDPAAMAEQLQVPSLSVAYDNLLPTLQLDSIPDVDDGRPKADKGLIAITVFLSIALLLIASVVLYITGGWAACHQCCINCLFEEIEEEDEYAVAKKSTFQVQSYDEEENRSTHDEHEEEEEKVVVQAEVQSELESVAPSEMSEDVGLQTLPEGLLGATHHPNPAAGLGIKTPNRADTSGYDSEINMTPMSELTSDHGPLGITSMRKLPLADDTDDEEVEGGLAHLILKRRFRENRM